MPKINDEDIYKNDYYRSILNLFRFCSSKDFKQIGLTHGQILYALSGRPKEDAEMKKFFDQFTFGLEKDKKFIDLYKSKPLNIGREINKTCPELIRCFKSIKKTPTYKQLNDKLQFLINRGWIETKDTKPRYYTYYITNKYYIDMDKRDIRSRLNEWDEKQAFKKNTFGLYLAKDSKDLLFNFGISGEKFDWTLFGLTPEILTKLSDKEKKDLHSWLVNIEKNLWNIMELKFSKQKITGEEFRKQIKKGDTTYLDSQPFRTINFFYYGYKRMVSDK